MTRILLILFGVLLVVLLGRLWIGSGSFPQIWYMEKQIETLAESNQQQQENNRKLEAEIQELKEGNEAVEARARNDFGMIKKGETFYQVILQPEEEQPPKQSANPAESDATTETETTTPDQ